MKQIFALVALALCAVGTAQAQGLPDAIAQPYLAYNEAMEAREYAAAREAALQAWRAAEAVDHDAETTAILADNYAQLASAFGEHEAARDAYRSAAELLEGTDMPAGVVAETWVLAARSALAAGDNRDAMRCADTAGDLAENAEAMDARARAELIFSSRSVQAHAQWRNGQIGLAALRAGEAMEAADGFDLTDNSSYGLMAFILGADSSMAGDQEEAAFRLTEAYYYLAEQRSALRYWADYVRGQLDEEGRRAVLQRINMANFPDLAPAQDEEDADPLPSLEEAAANEDRDAQPQRRRPPTYPPDAARVGADGVAVVRFDVDETGRTLNAEVVISLPYREFGEAALEAVERWRYEPAMSDGQPRMREGVITQFDFMMAD